MNPRRRTLVIALGLAPLGTLAQPRPLAPGVDYTELKPGQPVDAQGKIEVLEFFWYGCPACYTLEPFLEKWIPRLPADVQFRRVPAVLNPGWVNESAAYYTFEALGVLDKLHRPFFDAIHRDRLSTRDPAALSQWLAKNGVDAKKYQETLKSFGVQSRVRRAAQLSAAYRIDGTPSMAVHGRYTVSVEQARTWEGMLATIENLVSLARKGAK